MPTRLRLRWSSAGFLVAALFLGLAATVLGWLVVQASTNPADSGEGGVLLLPFALPWILLLPDPWLGPTTGLAAIALNALLLYLAVGGLRPARAPATD